MNRTVGANNVDIYISRENIKVLLPSQIRHSALACF